MKSLEAAYINSHNMKPSGSDYYLVSVNPSSSNVTYASFFSVWNNVKTDKHEERRIDGVQPEVVLRCFASEGQKVSVVDDATCLHGLINIGGHGLIEKSVMTSHWSEVLVPKLTVATHGQGMIAYDSLPRNQINRVARGTFRIEIMGRDSCQCRICGSSQDDGPHVRLEVHHIKPWEEGGITEPDNLITLCNACHSGIKAINRNLLYKKIGIHFPNQNNLMYNPKSWGLRHIIGNAVLFKIDKRKIK